MSRLICFGFALAGLVPLVTASAATIQHSFTISSQEYANLTGATSQLIPGSAMAISFSVPRYDPAVNGPLTSVNIAFSTIFQEDVDTGTTGGGTSFGFAGDLSFDAHPYAEASAGNGNGGGPGTTFSLLAPVSSNIALTDLNNPSVQALLGTGNSTFLWNDTIDVFVQSYAGGSAHFFRQGGGSLVVTYTYVPEPSAIVCVALTGLLMLRRSKKVLGVNSHCEANYN